MPRGALPSHFSKRSRDPAHALVCVLPPLNPSTPRNHQALTLRSENRHADGSAKVTDRYVDEAYEGIPSENVASQLFYYAKGQVRAAGTH